MREEMTVHQALCELKVLSKRVLKGIQTVKPISVKEHASSKVDGMDVAEFKKNAESDYASVTTLINRWMAIKEAISKYNASKVVTVAGKEYTIAQAIWYMNYDLADKTDLLERLTRMYNTCNANIEKANGENLNRRAEAAMESIYGAKEKANSEDYLKGLEAYKTAHAMELVAPLKIRDVIEKLDEEISNFMSGVDAAIQIANATTTIVIEY